MKTKLQYLAFLVLTVSCVHADDATTPAEKSFDAPHGMKMSVKMVGPYGQVTDLQIICVFKHKAAGDVYISAMKDLDNKLGGLISSLRNRGEFVGELGETISFIPPADSTLAKQFLVIGLGDEADLSLHTMRVVGTVALREAIKLKAAHISFAPVLRDQGNNKLDVGECDRSVEEGWLLAYDTEKRLQAQGLADAFNIQDLTFEAGPTFFAGAAAKLEDGIKISSQLTGQRQSTPYSSAKAP
jgi:hypothetical protein